MDCDTLARGEAPNHPRRPSVPNDLPPGNDLFLRSAGPEPVSGRGPSNQLTSIRYLKGKCAHCDLETLGRAPRFSRPMSEPDLSKYPTLSSTVMISDLRYRLSG